MCNGKCAGANKDERVTTIVAAIASNPEFIRTVGRRYGTAGEAPSMKEIATALLQLEDYLSRGE